VSHNYAAGLQRAAVGHHAQRSRKVSGMLTILLPVHLSME